MGSGRDGAFVCAEWMGRALQSSNLKVLWDSFLLSGLLQPLLPYPQALVGLPQPARFFVPVKLDAWSLERGFATAVGG